MVKLYTFKPGALILSSEINANFSNILSVIGTNSTETEFAPPGGIAFGSRKAGTISALTDRVSSTDGYLHVGWNAQQSYSAGGEVVLNRVGGLTSGATELRIGNSGFSIRGTRNSVSDLNTEGNFPVQLAIKTDEAFYVNPSLSFTSADKPKEQLEITDYRLTYIPLENPVSVTTTGGSANISDRSFDISALSLGISGYHGIELLITGRRNLDPRFARISGEVQAYGLSMDPLTGTHLVLHGDLVGSVRGPVFFKRGATPNNTLVIKTTSVPTLTATVVGVWK